MDGNEFKSMKELAAWRQAALAALDVHADYEIFTGARDFDRESGGVRFVDGKASLAGLAKGADDEDRLARLEQLRWFLNAEPKRRVLGAHEMTPELAKAEKSGDRDAAYAWVLAYRLEKVGGAKGAKSAPKASEQPAETPANEETKEPAGTAAG